MFDGITVCLMIFLLSALEESWIMGFPIDKCVMCRERKGRSVKWINVGPHPIVFFLRDQTICLDKFPVALVLVRLFTVLSLSLHKRNNNISLNFMSYLIIVVNLSIIYICN